MFNQEQWEEDGTQIILLSHPSPYFSIGEFLAIENERMIPQQAAYTVTNIDDTETYIKAKESNEKN